MKCEKCGLEGLIYSSETDVEGDKSPETKTKVFEKMHFMCRNEKCGNFRKEIGTERVEIYSEK